MRLESKVDALYSTGPKGHVHFTPHGYKYTRSTNTRSQEFSYIKDNMASNPGNDLYFVYTGIWGIELLDPKQ